MYLKRNDIEFLLFSRYLMMNSLLCLWKFNFYRNLCKDCFAPLSWQGLDKDSGRNRSIIKHKKGYYLSVIAPILQLHALWSLQLHILFLLLKKRNNTGFKLLCCYKVFTLHSYSCGILTFRSCATVDSVTTTDGLGRGDKHSANRLTGNSTKLVRVDISWTD